MMVSNKVLFLLHVPPPVHGSSIVGLAIKNSEIINKGVDGVYINLLLSKKISDAGSLKFLKFIYFFHLWFKVLFSITTNKPKLCYFALSTTSFALYKDFMIVLLLKSLKIKCIYHLHNKGVGKYYHSKIHNYLFSFIFNNSDVILLSERLYYDIEPYIQKSNIYICPNGIKDESLNRHLETIKKDMASVRILFLSNLIESKGVFILLKACALLKTKGLKFNCYFVGGEGDITATRFNEQLLRLDLTNEVKYLGKMFGTEKSRIYQESDIFALPTFNDCFPLVTLEAMSFSLPIISTVEGGIPDIVEHGSNGILVPPNNVEALADGLEILISDPHLRYQMGKSSRMIYDRKFTLDKFEIRISKVLQDKLKTN